ncbi:hypothetical protein CVT26_006501, partial [Gymnopilus dilepis]
MRGDNVPEWFKADCHALPGGDVIVRESDWGSVIAHTLSTADYQLELAALSMPRPTPSSQPPTPRAIPEPGPPSSFFSGYKLFSSSSSTSSSPSNTTTTNPLSTFSSSSGATSTTIATTTTTTSGSGTPNTSNPKGKDKDKDKDKSQPDPDSDDIVWNEPESYSAVITRKEQHTRDPTSLLSIRDVLRHNRALIPEVNVNLTSTGRDVLGSAGGNSQLMGGGAPKLEASGGEGASGEGGNSQMQTVKAKANVGLSIEAADGNLVGVGSGRKNESAERLLLQELVAGGGGEGRVSPSPGSATSRPASVRSVLNTNTARTQGSSAGGTADEHEHPGGPSSDTTTVRKKDFATGTEGEAEVASHSQSQGSQSTVGKDNSAKPTSTTTATAPIDKQDKQADNTAPSSPSALTATTTSTMSSQFLPPPPVPPKDNKDKPEDKDKAQQQLKRDTEKSALPLPPTPSEHPPSTSSGFASTLANGLNSAMRYVLSHEHHPWHHDFHRPGSASPSSSSNPGSRSMSPSTRHPMLGSDFPSPHAHPHHANQHLNANLSLSTAPDERPHIKYDWTIGKRLKFSCTVYYARQFDVLRRRCGVSNEEFVRSLERSAGWKAVGGKSKSNFWKTGDGRFVIKTLVNAWNVADLQVLNDLAPSYFRYMDSTASRPSALVKLLGFYTIEIRNLETGSVQSKADLLVMENLFWGMRVG